MATGMELLLNLAWLLVAVSMSLIWLRVAPRKPAERRMQLVALAVLILVLLPAISMTDDLAAQNPAETDSYLRRDHGIGSPHSIFPVTVPPPLQAFAGLGLRSQRLVAPGMVPAPAVPSPGLGSIQNRPPPAA